MEEPMNLRQMEAERRQRQTGLGEDWALEDKQSVTHFVPARPHLPNSRLSQTVSPAGHSEHTAHFGGHVLTAQTNVPVNCN